MTHPGQILKQANLYAGKELGQNFLSDPGTAQKIIKKTGITENSRVLEIGPGLGALTIPIANTTRHVVAIEKDRRLIRLLEQELENNGIDHVKIINADILKTDIASMAGDGKLSVIGNLPYNISSQIMIQLITVRDRIEKAFLMFQKELARRILEPPGGRDYSRLSAIVQYAACATYLMDVGPSSFFPRPEVDSTILAFDFFPDPDFDAKMEKILFSVIKAAFSKRRKTLRNSLAGTQLNLEKNQIAKLLEQAGIDAQRRAETLSVAEFKSITKVIVES